MPHMALTDTACRSAKPKDKPYKLTDGQGMYLEIIPAGGKYWRLKFRLHGKEKKLSLGTYPITSLAEAREKRDAAKKQLAKGIDPSLAKQEDKRQKKLDNANTFEVVAREWHALKKPGWSDRHAVNIIGRLENDIFPSIGKLAITDITAPRILEAVREIEKRGAHETGKRCLQYCRQVFTYGIGIGRLTHNPASDLSSLLSPTTKAHFTSLEFDRLPAFLKALDRNEPCLHMLTRLATLLLLHTFVPTTELIKATWDEIDLEKAVWIIPAHRMKMRKQHIVPLSTQAVELFRQVKDLSGNSTFVFPSNVRSNKHMSDGTILGAIRRLGYKDKTTGHGFRALAMSAIKERLKYRHDVVDRQLAHAPRSKVDAAYDRAAFLDDRKVMMQEWSDLIDRAANTSSASFSEA